MRPLKKTYRVLAAVVLIAMVANVLLPASAAAGRYICSINYTQHTGTINHVVDCCSLPGQTDAVNSIYEQNYKSNFTAQACSIREIFEYALATEISKTPVILTNGQHHVFAVLTPLTTIQAPFDRHGRDHFLMDVTASFPDPPIFLLNSSFLN